MDLCVHFGQPAFIVLKSSLYLYFGFSNKHFSIQFNFKLNTDKTQLFTQSQLSGSFKKSSAFD